MLTINDVMTAQRLLKLFAMLSLVATACAGTLWYQTGQPPDPWLVRISVAAFVAALATGFIGAETRPRLMLRFLAALFALLALITFAIDHSGQGSEGPAASSSLLDHLASFAPSLLASAKSAVTRVFGASAWDPVMTFVLGFPAYVIFGCLAAACGYAGRPRRRVAIFVNE